MDLRYRGEFPAGWKTNVSILFNADRIDETTIVNLLAEAGISVGLGEWRTEKGGTWGGFQVASGGKTRKSHSAAAG